MESQTRGGTFAGINITPMADIMIVILVIFMVATPLLGPGAAVSLPQGRNAARGEEGETITLTRSGSILLGGVAVEPDGLLERLRTALRNAPEGATKVRIGADAALPYETVARVLSLCRESGAEEITLSTRP